MKAKEVEYIDFEMGRINIAVLFGRPQFLLQVLINRMVRRAQKRKHSKQT